MTGGRSHRVSPRLALPLKKKLTDVAMKVQFDDF